MAEHSPLPWRFGPDTTSAFGIFIYDSAGFVAGECSGPTDDGDQANAEFIVKAVNHHGELVAALKVAREILERNGIVRPEIDAALAKVE